MTLNVDGVIVEKDTVSAAADMIKHSRTLRLAKDGDPPFEVFKSPVRPTKS